MSDTVLKVRDLQVQFKSDEKLVKAVDGISFDVKRGQTIGIVGESGSGKSVTSLAIMGLVPAPGQVTAGDILFQGVAEEVPVNLRSLLPEQQQHYRGGEISMIFQEPMSSLNPVYNIGFQMSEAILLHQKVPPRQARRLAIALLQEVKLLPSDEELREKVTGAKSDREIVRQINEQKLAILKRYPHELSGGQLQRVMIAMAISCNPTLLIADEPTTALDVTVQATILRLLRDLRNDRGMSLIFITHDLGVIAEIADSVAVMYQGKIVEYGSVWQIFSNPQHPYTKGLLACRPRPEERLRYLPTVADFMEVVATSSGEKEIREKTAASSQIKAENLSKDSPPSSSPSSSSPTTEQKTSLAEEDAAAQNSSQNSSQSSPPSSSQSSSQNSSQSSPPSSSQSSSQNSSQSSPPSSSQSSSQSSSREISPPSSSQNSSQISSPSPTTEQKPSLSEEDAAERLTKLQEQEPLLDVRKLQVSFPVRGIFGQTQSYVMAVNGVSFQVYPGETLGLVGESGCGKTTLARTLLRLIEPSAGEIVFEKQDILGLADVSLRKLRRQMQIVFQNPFSSLNPRISIGKAVMEPLQIHSAGNKREIRDRASYLLERVGLNSGWMNRYPHQFSGGQRQRVCIARALALNPKFIICDESVSALDVSVQAQVLNLLKELQSEFELTYIFISHDLGVVKFMSDRIMVMNKGKIEEIGPAEAIYRNPQQAYTRKLIASIPSGSLERIRELQDNRT
ncbi:MAG: ABC transporter ATP-binding protein [Oscillatoria sp. SIO1A7]|nr:ABC transporter ATP-binding protein [Oscillatoria sp. SIO1A7]